MDYQNEFLQYLYDTASANVDLASTKQHSRLYRLSDQLMDCQSRQRREMASDPQAAAEFRMASLLLDSRAAVHAVSQPLKVAVVFPMWGEHARLQPPCENNPDGEDTLRIKLDQLNWLFDRSLIDWQLYAIDDGCPWQSGEIAADIGRTHPHGDRLTVAWLEQQLPTFNSALRRLKSAGNSRKGGAIIHGCELALADGADAVVYTNADNATHLGQIGLLLESFTDGFDIVIGNREDPASGSAEQVIIQGDGNRFLQHIHYMIGQDLYDKGIRDIHSPFKLYSRAALQHIFQQPLVFDHSFDTDWLLAGVSAGYSFQTRPFSFVSSVTDAHSLKHQHVTHCYDRLKGLVTQVRTHDVSFNKELCAVIDRHIHAPSDLEALVGYLPEQLNGVADTTLGNPALMSPPEIERWILQCTQFLRQQQAA